MNRAAVSLGFNGRLLDCLAAFCEPNRASIVGKNGRKELNIRNPLIKMKPARLKGARKRLNGKPGRKAIFGFGGGTMRGAGVNRNDVEDSA